MLDIAYLRENLELARVRLSHRGYTLDVETFKHLDGERKSLIQEVELLRQQLKSGSAEIGKLKRDKTDTSALQNKMTEISEQIKTIEAPLKAVEDKLSEMAAVMPNLPDPSVPLGFTEEENVEVRRVGEVPKFNFAPKAHWDIGPALGILDSERGSKVTGSRFYYLAGRGLVWNGR
jgi:seryl-tRNA synthetase